MKESAKNNYAPAIEFIKNQDVKYWQKNLPCSASSNHKCDLSLYKDWFEISYNIKNSKPLHEWVLNMKNFFPGESHEIDDSF